MVTAAEKARVPEAYTFNRATGRLHNRAGFEIPELHPLATSSFSRAPSSEALQGLPREKNEEGEPEVCVGA